MGRLCTIAHVYFLHTFFILLYLLAKLSGVDVDYLMIKSMTVLMIAVLPIKTSTMVFDQNSSECQTKKIVNQSEEGRYICVISDLSQGILGIFLAKTIVTEFLK